MTYALWIVQGLLAAIFLFAGGTKLVLPVEDAAREQALREEPQRKAAKP